MALSSKSLAGPGYIILNVIRGLNIIAFLMVIAACVVMLVKTSVHSKFFFFDAVSHCFTMMFSMFFLASELSLFRGYFARNWPLLSPSHGFVALAVAMVLIGVDILGNLNDQAESHKALGSAFWQLVICSGIVIFIMGWINLIASYIFRDRKNEITARQVRAHGAVAVQESPKVKHGSPSQSYISASATPRTPPSKSSNAFRILTSERRSSTLPSYHASTSSPTGSTTKEDDHEPAGAISPSSRYSRATACTKKKVFGFMGRNSLAPPLPVNPSSSSGRPMEISAPMGVNPQFAHLVQRPDSALHPSRTGESDPYRWRPVS